MPWMLLGTPPLVHQRLHPRAAAPAGLCLGWAWLALAGVGGGGEMVVVAGVGRWGTEVRGELRCPDRSVCGGKPAGCPETCGLEERTGTQAKALNPLRAKGRHVGEGTVTEAQGLTVEGSADHCGISASPLSPRGN